MMLVCEHFIEVEMPDKCRINIDVSFSTAIYHIDNYLYIIYQAILTYRLNS